MGWNEYGLDREAQKLILQFRDDEVLGEVYKMRTTVAFGLERFWGEHLRLQRSDSKKSRYWKAVWDTLVAILSKASIKLPNDSIAPDSGKDKTDPARTNEIKAMANQLWEFSAEQPLNQRIALQLLTQLCDSLVWWTQRYK